MPIHRHDRPAARETFAEDVSQISIIIPVYQGGEAFLYCLHALAQLTPAAAGNPGLDGIHDGSGKEAEMQGARVAYTGT